MTPVNLYVSRPWSLQTLLWPSFKFSYKQIELYPFQKDSYLVWVFGILFSDCINRYTVCSWNYISFFGVHFNFTFTDEPLFLNGGWVFLPLLRISLGHLVTPFFFVRFLHSLFSPLPFSVFCFVLPVCGYVFLRIIAIVIVIISLVYFRNFMKVEKLNVCKSSNYRLNVILHLCARTN